MEYRIWSLLLTNFVCFTVESLILCGVKRRFYGSKIFK